METILYISIAEAAGRLGMTVAEVEELVAEGALEARETEAGKAVAEDDVADPFMRRDTPRWLLETRRLQRRESGPVDTAMLVRELREERDEYGA
jgi:type IV secretory pathway TrbL component